MFRTPDRLTREECLRLPFITKKPVATATLFVHKREITYYSYDLKHNWNFQVSFRFYSACEEIFIYLFLWSYIIYFAIQDIFKVIPLKILDFLY